MAGDKKEKPKGWNFDPIEGVIVLLFILTVVATLGPMLIRYFSSGEFSFYGMSFSGLADFFKNNSLIFKALGFSIAGGAAVGTFILNRAADAIRLAEKAKLFSNLSSVGTVATGVSTTQSAVGGVAPIKFPSETVLSRWKKIIEYTESNQDSNWRLAIIEADIMLGDLLDTLHLPGNTIGEKLKAVERSDFNTLDYAWEAHKARNMIAHEGSNFMLNQRETRRIIGLYEAVLKEFYVI